MRLRTIAALLSAANFFAYLSLAIAQTQVPRLEIIHGTVNGNYIQVGPNICKLRVDRYLRDINEGQFELCTRVKEGDWIRLACQTDCSIWEWLPKR